ncbi:MAG TPA: hypothetical protein V6D11_12415 [Waterburya sp.]|jgi:hypothetical protein
MSYCQIGDSPTVYYKFKGQSNYAKVTFATMAPIDISIENTSSSSGSDGSGPDPNPDNAGSPYYPCPPSSSVCTLVYTAQFRYGDNYGFEPGQCNSYSSEGFSILECYLYSFYDGNDDAEFRYEDFAFVWSLRATTTYRYQKSVARPNPPTNYDEYVSDGNGLFLNNWGIASDSCFPNGGDPLTCSDSPPDSPPPPPPPPSSSPSPDTKAQVKLKVFYDSKLIWSKTGEPPLDYEVACSKDECPPGMCKLNNSQGFCCVKSDELKEPINVIKTLLRHSNG